MSSTMILHCPKNCYLYLCWYICYQSNIPNSQSSLDHEKANGNAQMGLMFSFNFHSWNYTIEEMLYFLIPFGGKGPYER